MIEARSINDPDDLRGLIRQGRGERFDWLDGRSASPDRLAPILTAMANGQGGTLVIGVRGARGDVEGVSDPAAIVDRVLEAAMQVTPHLILPLPTLGQIAGKPIVVARVPSGMPHVYAFDGRFLIREGKANTALQLRQLHRLLLERGDASFETEATPQATNDDLNWDHIRAYNATLGGKNDTDAELLLVRRGCLIVIGGQARPTNAGMLLFGREPQRFIRGTEITAVRFAGSRMSDNFQRQDIGGTLPDQIRQAETFLRAHLHKSVRLGKGMARDERYEYPLEAVREIVVNAVAHRDYSIRGDGIRLFIYDDHLEVMSPGKLPGPVTVRNIKDERFSRNPVIVQVLADMRFIERLGYGVDRVIDLMQEYGLEAPRFSETDGGFRVLLTSARGQIVDAPSSLDPDDNDLFADGLFEGKPVNSRQETALKYLILEKNMRITNSDLQMLCPEVHPETIRRDLVDLVKKGILQKQGEKRGSFYVLKE